jgi:hypothetical protein
MNATGLRSIPGENVAQRSRARQLAGTRNAPDRNDRQLDARTPPTHRHLNRQKFED